MFKNNKYTKWYDNIIKKAQTRTITGYVEKHHIIPRCMGGNDDINNIVPLTAREHFIVHLLLIRMVEAADIYRMVHAIIRFTNKVKNSKEYSLLRTYVSTYSKGKYNKSYGKIWAHITDTKDIIYILKEELDLSIHTKGLPYQRGGVPKGYIWINNESKSRLVNPNKSLLKGWRVGCLHGGNVQHMKYVTQFRHTPEKDAEHSKKLTGRVAIKLANGDMKRVHPDTLGNYIKDGWVLVKKLKYLEYVRISYNNTIYEYKNMRIFCQKHDIPYGKLRHRKYSKKLPWRGITSIETFQKLIP